MRAFWLILVAGCGFKSPAGAVDGMPPDADETGSGSLVCPPSYNLKLHEPSRYRLITEGHRAWEQSNDCNDDQTGATHLVVIETPEELVDIKKFVMNPGPGVAGDAVWIGGVQLMSATQTDEGWLGFDGAPLGASLIMNGWGGSEPNDGGGGENHSEQFVVMERGAPYFIDVSGKNTIVGALCECDGKPINTMVAALVTSYSLLP